MNVPATQVNKPWLHSRAEVGVAGADSYCSSVHVPCCAHTRSVDAVGTFDWYSVSSAHTDHSVHSVFQCCGVGWNRLRRFRTSRGCACVDAGDVGRCWLLPRPISDHQKILSHCLTSRIQALRIPAADTPSRRHGVSKAGSEHVRRYQMYQKKVLVPIWYRRKSLLKFFYFLVLEHK